MATTCYVICMPAELCQAWLDAHAGTANSTAAVSWTGPAGVADAFSTSADVSIINGYQQSLDLQAPPGDSLLCAPLDPWAFVPHSSCAECCRS